MSAIQPRFTRESYERLKHELEALKQQRAGVRQELQEAREQGDLRENFAYHDAKRNLSLLESRIGNLELRLDDAIIVEEGANFDEVVLGVPVTVRPESGGEDRIYTIVPSEELDSYEDAASDASPIGSALLGKKVGDIAEVQGPRGLLRFEVVSIGAS